MTIVEKFVNEKWDRFIGQLPDFDECDDTLSDSIAILDKMGYSGGDIDEICDWFRLNGGYCDCEVLMNLVMEEKEYWRWDEYA